MLELNFETWVVRLLLLQHMRACSHIVHQTQTQRGAKSGDIVLEGNSLILCLTHSLYMSFTNNGYYDQNYIFQCKGVCIEIVEVEFYLVKDREVLIVDSFIELKSEVVINPSCSNTGRLFGLRQRYNSGWA